jgi:hypothetical protein
MNLDLLLGKTGVLDMRLGTLCIWTDDREGVRVAIITHRTILVCSWGSISHNEFHYFLTHLLES